MSENPESTPETLVRPRLWYLMQLISLILMALVGAGLFSVLGLKVIDWVYDLPLGALSDKDVDFSDPKILNSARILQVFAAIGAFVFPCIVQLAFMKEPLAEGLGITTRVGLKQVLGVILLLLAVQPLISYMTVWMLGLHFPESLAELEESLRGLHDSALEQQMAFLKDQGWSDYFFNLFMVALLAAFTEELFFRRVALRLLFDTTGNAHVSILISALLFALIHGQFFFLLPLFTFGVILGYLALWSRSLWLPVLGHFLNNALSVSLVFFQGESALDPDSDPGFGIGWIALLISIVASAALLYYIYRNQPAEDGRGLDSAQDLS